MTHPEQKRDRIPTVVLAVSMFVTGGCGLVAQYILSTVSTYILGNSIEQFSVIIALTLLMMGIAGVVQRFISDDRLVEKFVATEVGLGLLTGFTPLALYGAYAMLYDHFTVVQYVFILGVGFLIGLEIPLAIRINEKYSRNLAGNIANIWALDYVGSFVGALIWAFVLIRLLPLTEISFYIGLTNCLIGCFTLFVFRARGQARLSAKQGFAMVGAVASMIFGLTINRGLAFDLEQKLYNDRIVFATTTKYQRLVITEDPKIQDTRLFINGNLQFSSLDEAIYHEQLVHPAMNLAAYRRKVLVLGGGDGLALREILKYKDVESVTLVDIDPGMIELGKTDPRLVALNKGALKDARVSADASKGIEMELRRRDIYQEVEDPRPQQRSSNSQRIATVNVFTVDAASFIDQSANMFDVILVDLPDPSTVELAKLYSREFYTGLRQRLAKDGVMVVQSTSPFHAKDAFLCTRRTLDSAGWITTPYQDNVPSFGSWGWILCTTRPLPTVKIKIPVETRYLTPEVFSASLIFGKGALDTPEKDVSTLMNPRVMDYYVRSGWQMD